MLNKELLRKRYLKIRNELKSEFLEVASQKLIEKVVRFIEQEKFQTIGIYLSQNNEVPTIKIIDFCLRKGIKVYLPWIIDHQTSKMGFKQIQNLDKDLESSQFLNLKQPKKRCLDLPSPNTLEVLFVPVVAFDCKLHRIGMGKGYYDFWILNSGFNNLLVGLAWSLQKAPQTIEVESHDVSLTCCLTEKENYGFS